MKALVACPKCYGLAARVGDSYECGSCGNRTEPPPMTVCWSCNTGFRHLHYGGCPWCGAKLRKTKKRSKAKAKRKARRKMKAKANTEQARLDEALRCMDARSWHEYLTELRRLERRAGRPRLEFTSFKDFAEDHGGHPLGKGMPLGSPLRGEDGKTHRQGWMDVVRADPCSYCGRASAGTVDHIVPQSASEKRASTLGGLHSWLNYTAACANCNTKKSANSLLMFLAARR